MVTADTVSELHEFAARVGLRRGWFHRPALRPHAVPLPPSTSIGCNSYNSPFRGPQKAYGIQIEIGLDSDQ